MKRIVLDTNVTISAFFWSGHPRAVYDLVRNGNVVMLISQKMEREFIRVLGYPKFGLSSLDIVPLIKNLRQHAEFVRSNTVLSVITTDPTDNIFLECAVDGKADCIISGDRHLLDLDSYNGISILRPKAFLMQEGFVTE